MDNPTRQAAPKSPSWTFSDNVSAGVLGPAGGAGVAATAFVLATALVLALGFTMDLVLAVVVLLDGGVERQPTSMVAATNMIGMNLRIMGRSNAKCAFELSLSVG